MKLWISQELQCWVRVCVCQIWLDAMFENDAHGLHACTLRRTGFVLRHTWFYHACIDSSDAITHDSDNNGCHRESQWDIGIKLQHFPDGWPQSGTSSPIHYRASGCTIVLNARQLLFPINRHRQSMRRDGPPTHISFNFIKWNGWADRQPLNIKFSRLINSPIFNFN